MAHREYDYENPYGVTRGQEPLEPDQMDAWRDDGGSCAHGHPEHRLGPEIEERPVWIRASEFMRKIISPVR